MKWQFSSFVSILYLSSSFASVSSLSAAVLLKAIKKSSGIYSDSLKVSSLGIDNVVLVTISAGVGQHQAQTFLENWLCFSARFEYKPLVFIGDSLYSHHSFSNIGKLNPLASFVAYSESSFRNVSGGVVAHGYVKLKLLESVLKLRRCDIIYIGTDVIFIHDPLPYILRGGKADITVSPVVDSCIFPSQRIPFSDQRFSVFSKDLSILFIRTSSILPSVASDLLSFFFTNFHNQIKFTSDLSASECVAITSIGGRSVPEAVPVQVCRLNEFLFQNDVQLSECSKAGTQASSAYFLGLIHMGHRSGESTDQRISPLTLHVKNSTASSIQKLGLWLVPESQSPTKECASLRYGETIFSNADWMDGLRKELAKVREASKVYPQGSLIKLPSSPTIYIVDKGQLRAFSSVGIFMKMNFDWTDILYIDASSVPLLHVFPFGPLVTIADTHLKSYALAGRKIIKSQKIASLFDNSTVNATAHLLGYKFNLWVNLSREAKLREPNRRSSMKAKLANVAGVYRDKAKSMKLGLQRTVLVSILAPAFEDLHGKYTQLLRNSFCYAAQYGYQPLTFLVPSKSKNFTTLVSELEHVGVKADFMTYPDEYFWNLLLRKRSPIVSFRRANYDGNIPSFENFGALTMLVPSLEVLEHGYDVIYFDLDIALVRDPIPFMLRGNADFLLSHEIQTCFYPSLPEFAVITDWERLEPNTGIFLARASPGLLALFRQWLDKIVDLNIMNDQRVLKFSEFGAQLSFSCNEALEHLEANKSVALMKPLLVEESDVKYCFLNELLFQNGKVSVNCAKGRGGSQAEYSIALNNQKGAHFSLDESTSASAASTTTTTTSSVTGSAPRLTKTLLSPLALHVNFCHDKIGEFKDLGLWLPHNMMIEAGGGAASSGHCRRHDLRKTLFATTNWDEKLAKAATEVAAARALFVNGTVLKLRTSATLYLFNDGKLHAFPDGDTFLKMGYQWGQIKNVPIYSFYKLYPNGPDIPSLVATS